MSTGKQAPGVICGNVVPCFVGFIPEPAVLERLYEGGDSLTAVPAAASKKDSKDLWLVSPRYDLVHDQATFCGMDRCS